ncbi:hypothetical protein HK098_001244 [Nowakowskiella sp. JEL0407]|nr:hypothetical protein HK098_001244 [Nowakowskiella sp. JEL0407]
MNLPIHGGLGKPGASINYVAVEVEGVENNLLKRIYLLVFGGRTRWVEKSLDRWVALASESRILDMYNVACMKDEGVSIPEDCLATIIARKIPSDLPVASDLKIDGKIMSSKTLYNSLNLNRPAVYQKK